MGVISGIGGAVDGINTVRAWTISSSADLQAGIASNTKGAPVVLAGNKDWNGNYTAYGHTPARMPGESFTFTGSLDGAKGVVGTARVSSVEIVIDIEAGAIIGHTVNFEADGALARGDAAAADTGDINMFSSIGCKVELADVAAEPSYEALPDVRVVTITLTADNPSYVSSSTAGQTRRPAGNLSAAVQITCYTDDLSDLPAENDVQAVRVYVDATTFWLFEWLRFGEQGDGGANREDAEVVGASLNGQFTGHTPISGTFTEGKIVLPSTTVFWPE